MPVHEFYADGSPRPLFRGWLHGLATLISVPWVVSSHLAEQIPAPALPGIVAICATLALSSLVHLVPWKSKTMLEIFVRLDKSGILAICGISFWSPQFLESSVCKTSPEIALLTNVIPLSISVLGVWCGCGPIVFVGCLGVIVETLWFYGTQVEDTIFFHYSVICIVLYGISLTLYVLQIGGHRRYWGYHEWMHLLVVCAFSVNARGLWLMSHFTDEHCKGENYCNNTFK